MNAGGPLPIGEAIDLNSTLHIHSRHGLPNKPVTSSTYRCTGGMATSQHGSGLHHESPRAGTQGRIFLRPKTQLRALTASGAMLGRSTTPNLSTFGSDSSSHCYRTIRAATTMQQPTITAPHPPLPLLMPVQLYCCVTDVCYCHDEQDFCCYCFHYFIFSLYCFNLPFICLPDL